MKHNIFIFGAFALAVLFLSCVKEELEPENQETVYPKAVFTTAAPPEFIVGTGTRTHMEGLDVKWDFGDEFIVFGKDGKRYKAKNTQEGDIAVFASDMTFDATGGLNGKGKVNELLYARHIIVYPSSAVTSGSKLSNDGKNMESVQIGNIQPLAENTFDKGSNVSYALLTTGNGTMEYNGDRLQFRNACGLLRLKLRSDNGAKITSIKIIGPEKSELTGRGVINHTLGGFIQTGYNDFVGRTDVTLKALNGPIELTSGVTDFYACVMPATTNKYSDSADFSKDEKLYATGTGAIAGEYTIIFTDDRNRTLTTTAILEEGVHAGKISTLGQYKINAESASWTSNNPPVEDGLSYVFDKTAVPEVHMSVSLAEWNRLLALYDENPHTSEYIHCDFTFNKNGQVNQIDDAGVRLRGSTSRRRPEVGAAGEMHTVGDTRWQLCHFMFNLRKFQKDDHHEIGGVRKIYMKYYKADPTFVSENYCYDLYERFGIFTGLKISYCRLYVHVEGEPSEIYYGVYRMMECVDERYLRPRWEQFGHAKEKDEYNLWKCGNDDNSRANLYDTHDKLFQHDDLAGDTEYSYVLKTNLEISEDVLNWENPKAQLVNFITNYKTLEGDEFRTWVESVTDVRLLLRTYAVVVMVGHWDDYWQNGKNFYIYFNSNDPENYKFFFIPYDHDNTLGNSSGGLDPVTHNPLAWGHPNETRNHLISKLLTFPDYRQIYIDALNELCDNDEYFGLEGSLARIAAWQDMIRPYVKNDIGEASSISDKNGNYKVMERGEKNYFTAKIKAVKAAIAADTTPALSNNTFGY